MPGGQVTVLDSVIDHNQAGGIDNDGGLRVERCLFEANSREDGSGTAATTAGLAGTVGETAVTNTDGATIVSSTIVGHRGGGLRNEEGNMALINVTVSGNSARLGAGGVTNEGTMQIRSSTITANQSTDGTSAGGLVSYEDSASSLTTSRTPSSPATQPRFARTGLRRADHVARHNLMAMPLDAQTSRQLAAI